MSTTARSRAIVFDFDGTVAVGDGPVLRYAHHTANALPAAARADFLADIASQLRFVSTDGGAPDGYALVRDTALSLGLPPDELRAAFILSRSELATELAPIAPPEGFAAFLEGIEGRALCVLATNSPDVGMIAALDALGVRHLFDHVFTSAGKPAGMDRVLDEVDPGQECGSPAERLLSIGDLWHNDLAPAAARGFSTALIGRHVPGGAKPSLVAERLSDLYAPILAWLDASVTPMAAKASAGVGVHPNAGRV
jgi:FMN phosphatase YigB (HAD superfamily)